jgi:hypothetical protein
MSSTEKSLAKLFFQGIAFLVGAALIACIAQMAVS